ncbi:MAG: proton-conducting transporter membrane subunit, partial [bacterium]
MMLERLPISFLIILPMLGALLCLGPWFARERDTNGRLCRAWALFVSVLTLGLLLALAKGIISSPDTANTLHESRSWIPSLGITFSLTLDGLSLVFALLTCVVSLSVIGWLSKPSASGAGWYALLLFGEASVLGAFLATDLVLFYCLYELMLLPVLGATALWGGPRRIQAALKFLLYTVAGSVPMFLAILYLVWQGQGNGYGLNGVGELSSTEQLTLGAAFLLAFAVKIPIVPLHGWLPDTYREAPYGIAAFTAALLGKVGIYAVVRFMFPLFPDFMHSAGPFLAAFGAVGVVYGALIATAQR